VAGRLLGWHDAPGQHGSAGRHPDIRGLGPHVGQTQEGAPDDGRLAPATASSVRGSVLQRRRPGASHGWVHLLGRSGVVNGRWWWSGGHLRPQEPAQLPSDRSRHEALGGSCGRPGPGTERTGAAGLSTPGRRPLGAGRGWRRAIRTPTAGRCFKAQADPGQLGAQVGIARLGEPAAVDGRAAGAARLGPARRTP
jgi:hypothetical protein